jgi:hypothetical protein
VKYPAVHLLIRYFKSYFHLKPQQDTGDLETHAMTSPLPPHFRKEGRLCYVYGADTALDSSPRCGPPKQDRAPVVAVGQQLSVQDQEIMNSTVVPVLKSQACYRDCIWRPIENMVM